MGAPRVWLRRLLVAAALAVVATVAYAPAGRLPFVNYDDNEYVLRNPHTLAGLTRETVHWAFTTAYDLNYHPLTWVSLAIDTSMTGSTDPAALSRTMHRTNVALHAASAAVLFLLLAMATGADAPAAFAAAVFAVHPAHVESVAWVSERKDVLCGLFFLLAVTGHVLFVQARTPSRRWPMYAATVLAGVAALLSKPMAVTLPVVLLAIDFWPLRRFAWGPTPAGRAITVRRAVVEVLPLVAAAIALSWITYVAQENAGAVQTIGDRPMMSRVLHVPVNYVRYLGKIVWPTDLSPYYMYHPSVPPLAFVGSVALLLAVTAVAAWQGRRRPYLIVGWIWFGVTLGPVVGIIPAGRQAIADRYLYLPLVGPAVMVAWAAADVLRRSTVAATVVAIAIVAALTGVTWHQIGYWGDTRTLFTHALAVDPDNAFAHAQLGYLDKVDGQLGTARWHYEQAVRLDPGYGDATYNLANMELPTDPASAAEHYRMTLAARPHDPRAENNLGVALSHDPAHAAEAAQMFRAAAADDPGWADPHLNLGRLYQSFGRPDLAAAEFLAAGRRP
jgi:Flp pilus assembly protein TadD